MNWTPQDALRFHNWEIDMQRWRACNRLGLKSAPPIKPKGYDLWKQGDNPLKLETPPAKPTDLVDPSWTPQAKPIPLPETKYTQDHLPLSHS